MSTPTDPHRAGVPSDQREANGSGGPTSPAAPPQLSRFAVRDDGALLVSLEDAAECDITGREVVTFLLLNKEETARARAAAEDVLSAVAAQALGRLPKRAK